MIITMLIAWMVTATARRRARPPSLWKSETAGGVQHETVLRLPGHKPAGLVQSNTGFAP